MDTAPAGPDTSGPVDLVAARTGTELGELFHTASRGLRRTWTDQLSPWGLGPAQWRALNAVARHGTGDDAHLRMRELADLLRIAPRSVTEVVDQLEEKGLVARRPDPEDRRATLVALTEQGRDRRSAVVAARREQATQFFAPLSPADQQELARLLRLLGADGHGG